MEEDYYIFGSTELGRLLRRFLGESGFKGFLVDEDFYDYTKNLDGESIPLSREVTSKLAISGSLVYVAVGYRCMKSRESVYSRLVRSGLNISSYISPHSIVHKDAKVGNGNLIFAGVCIEPGVEIGDNNIFWSNSIICHDSKIGGHNFFAAGCTVGGGVTIGKRCFLGFSSSIDSYVTLMNDVKLGANSFLRDSVTEPGLWAGSPAIEKSVRNYE